MIKLAAIKKITSRDMKLGHKLIDKYYTTVPCYCTVYAINNELLVKYFPIEKQFLLLTFSF